jgi:hypothetical protein
MIKPNESIHISIKNPPLTVRSIGVFDSDELIPDIIKKFLEGHKPSGEFLQNTLEEVHLLLAHSRILTVSSENDVYTVTMRKIK